MGWKVRWHKDRTRGTHTSGFFSPLSKDSERDGGKEAKEAAESVEDTLRSLIFLSFFCLFLPLKTIGGLPKGYISAGPALKFEERIGKRTGRRRGAKVSVCRE